MNQMNSDDGLGERKVTRTQKHTSQSCRGKRSFPIVRRTLVLDAAFIGEGARFVFVGVLSEGTWKSKKKGTVERVVQDAEGSEGEELQLEPE